LQASELLICFIFKLASATSDDDYDGGGGNNLLAERATCTALKFVCLIMHDSNIKEKHFLRR
jgi:hypothetical protein